MESLNERINDFGSKTKEFISGEKAAFNDFGTKAMEDVEDMTTDLIKEVKKQVNGLLSSSIEVVKKNPAIAIAAAVTLGLVIAKLMNRSAKLPPRMTH